MFFFFFHSLFVYLSCVCACLTLFFLFFISLSLSSLRSPCIQVLVLWVPERFLCFGSTASRPFRHSTQIGTLWSATLLYPIFVCLIILFVFYRNCCCCCCVVCSVCVVSCFALPSFVSLFQLFSVCCYLLFPSPGRTNKQTDNNNVLSSCDSSEFTSKIHTVITHSRLR